MLIFEFIMLIMLIYLLEKMQQ